MNQNFGASQRLEPAPHFAHAGVSSPSEAFTNWVRRFLACNPFYPVSAALLLYGCYRISSDSNFLAGEVAQLCFNLTSLQLYEALLVITAIFLARRSISYDSALLIGLENMLVLAPFIFISQAALIDPKIVWTLSIAGGLLAIARFGSLKRFVTGINLPTRVQLIGLAVLAVNVALPIAYRILHESKVGTKPDWGSAYITNEYAWYLVLPLLCAFAMMLPSAQPASQTASAHPLQPFGWFALWLMGTAVHLYCLGYIYDFALRPQLVAPGMWVLLWVVAAKVKDVFPELAPKWIKILLVLPPLATSLALATPEKGVFLILTGINTVIYCALSCARPGDRLAVHLFFVSVLAFIGGLPEEWYWKIGAEVTRSKIVAAGLAFYCLVWTAISRDAKMGLVGAFVACCSVAGLFGQTSTGSHLGIQIGLAFLLIHSLRWRDSEQDGAWIVRFLAALLWVAHAVVWTRLGGPTWIVCAFAALVLLASSLKRWLSGEWASRILPCASLLVLLSGPGNFTLGQMHTAPIGLLAILGSFLLFGVGTLSALTKSYWGVKRAKVSETESLLTS